MLTRNLFIIAIADYSQLNIPEQSDMPLYAPPYSGGLPMIGDVNLYYIDNDIESDTEYGDEAASEKNAESACGSKLYSSAEIEVMVAEQSARRSGCATETLWIVMQYAVQVLTKAKCCRWVKITNSRFAFQFNVVQELKIDRFVAKILDENKPSLRLFTRMGFTV